MVNNSTSTSTALNSAAQEDAPRQGARRKSSLAGIALVLALAVGAASAGVWFLLKHDQPEGAASTTGGEPNGVLVRLEGFTVNLADKEDNHFLRVTMELSFDHLPASTDRDKPTAGLPIARIRDIILSVLTVCNADTLLTPDGKVQLKKKLLEALNRNDPELAVRDIYFTEFLVQR